MKSKVRVVAYIVATLLLFFANILFVVADYVDTEFANMDFGTIMFHLKVPLEGTNVNSFQDIIMKCIVVGLVSSGIALFTALKFKSDEVIALHIGRRTLRFPIDFWSRYYVLGVVVICILSLVLNAHVVGADTYIMNQMSSSDFIKDNYVEPREVTLTFPEEKRNLIYIFLESMENTYASIEYGGNEYENFIPEMTWLQMENTNFSVSNTYLNGAYCPTGTTWTIGAIVAQTAGIPLSIPIDGNSMSYYSSFLPGAYTIGEVLEENGYKQVFLMGSDAAFGGRELYMTQHGDYEMLDYYYAIEKGWISEDYHVFWGYEDQKLFENAKEKLLELAQGEEPFNLTMLTVDSHFPEGYACGLCTDDFNGDVYANAISCSSRQVSEFVEWIQQQDFYENTTIVICGDHPTMNNEYMQNTMLDYDTYNRTVYTAVINSAVEYELVYNREFSTFDMYPTTLAAMGVEIEGERLALGTNLFADTPTLLEQYGIEYINTELSKTSGFYNRKLLYD